MHEHEKRPLPVFGLPDSDLAEWISDPSNRSGGERREGIGGRGGRALGVLINLRPEGNGERAPTNCPSGRRSLIESDPAAEATAEAEARAKAAAAAGGGDSGGLLLSAGEQSELEEVCRGFEDSLGDVELLQEQATKELQALEFANVHSILEGSAYVSK